MRQICFKSIRLWLSKSPNKQKFAQILLWSVLTFWLLTTPLWYKYESTRHFVSSMLPFVPCYITIHLFMDKHCLWSKYDPSVVPSTSNIFQPTMTRTNQIRTQGCTDGRTHKHRTKQVRVYIENTTMKWHLFWCFMRCQIQSRRR